MKQSCRAFARALSSLCVCAAAAYAAPADDLRALVERGDHRAAYAEGRKHPESLGNPEFDFYFGVAAIESGHASEGVLALERYLALFPDNFSARLQLARGYFVSGDDAHARVELESIVAANPPIEVRTVAMQYLDAVRAREGRYTLRMGGYAEAGGGYDSNVNAGPAAESIFLPGFGLQPLDPASRRVSSYGVLVGLGGYVTYPVLPRVALFANGTAERHWHREEAARRFELGNYNVAGGVSLGPEKDAVRLGVSYGLLTVGPDRYRSTSGAFAEWQHELSPRSAFSAALQAARLSYPQLNAPRDADYVGASAAYRTVLEHAWRPNVSIGVNAGRQRTRTDHPELVPKSYGAHLSVTLAPHAAWGIQAAYLFQRSRYQAPDFFAFPEAREDRYHAFNAAVSYAITRELSIRLDALASRNHSNADAYAFPRETYWLKLRYETR